ncbi:MAG: hydrogenase maturation protease [Dehalococcoidia bacterium]|nr:hydrogenase maturation protease [Dehalococcoidia bacterium]
MSPGESNKRTGEIPTLDSSVLVLGVGNILLSDEGVGIHVIEAMKTMPLPENVELLDGGTASLELIDIISNRKKVIIIDAVKGCGEPGTLYRFGPKDIEVKRPMLSSLHQIGLLEALAVDKFFGGSPQDIIIYGVEPKELGWGLDLSPEIKASVPCIIELIMDEL